MYTVILCFAFLIGIFAITFLQTHKNIIIRSLGLLIILGAGLWFDTTGTIYNMPLIIISIILTILGILSDIYTAILRTWGFQASVNAYWGGIIGGFIGLLSGIILKSFFLSFMVGTILGIFIGEIMAKRSGLFKKTIGAFTGLFGMGVKLLFGLTIIEIHFLF